MLATALRVYWTPVALAFSLVVDMLAPAVLALFLFSYAINVLRTFIAYENVFLHMKKCFWRALEAR
jgi:hypothetical protein